MNSNQEQKEKNSVNTIKGKFKGMLGILKERIYRRLGPYLIPHEIAMKEEEWNVRQLFRLGIFFLPNEFWPVFDRKYDWFDLNRDKGFYHAWAKTLGTGLFFFVTFLSLVVGMFVLQGAENSIFSTGMAVTIMMLPLTGLTVWLMCLMLQVKLGQSKMITSQGSWLFEVLFHLLFYGTLFKIYKGLKGICNWFKKLQQEV